MSNLAQGFPNISVPPIGPDGRWNQTWYLFLVSLFTRTGGSSGNSTTAIQKQVNDLAAQLASDEKWIAMNDLPAAGVAVDQLLAEMLAEYPVPARYDFDQATLRALLIANDTSDVPVARTNLLGISRPDGTTVTINNGVLSSSGLGGSVTSVGLAVPTGFTVSGSPVTSSGTLTIGLSNETANFVWAGPVSGPAAVPAFRALVAADLPTITSLGTVVAGTWAATPVAVSSGGTGDTGTAWTAYTPTITAGSGTFTTVSATGRWKAIGKTVFFQISITITTNGTAATNIVATLPVTSGPGVYAAIGRESATQTALDGIIGSASPTISLRKYDSTYPGASGSVCNLSGCYESA